MSHLAQQRFCLAVRQRFPDLFIGKRVLDVGSLDINGNNRSLFTDCDYIGLDLGGGPNVDVACKAHEYEGEDNSFDVVISTETFEHDARYAESLTNILRLLRPAGLLLFTCATVGRAEHGTRRSSPQDSPLTCRPHLWPDYYRNLTEEDIRRVFDPDEVFIEYEFHIEANHCDLHFWGIKSDHGSARVSRTTLHAVDEGASNKDARTLNLMYVGRFDRLWNECEIADALRRRGHRVTTCHESSTKVEDVLAALIHQPYDALLFHKGRLGVTNQADILRPSGDEIARLIRDAPVPCYMWYFDRAHQYDLAPDREIWMKKVAPLCTIAFVTDGGLLQTDYANWRLLRQGAFHRQVRTLEVDETEKRDLVFLGQMYGQRRKELKSALECYEIDHVEDAFGPELTPIVRRHRIVLGPRYPSSPGYWSNRIYLILGHGGFFLAPEVDGMREDGFLPGVHYAAIGPDLVADIRYWLDHPAERQRIASQGRAFVLKDHTIDHRVAELCEAILDTCRGSCERPVPHVSRDRSRPDGPAIAGHHGANRHDKEESVESVGSGTQITGQEVRSPMIVTMIPYCPRSQGQDLGFAYNQMMERLADDDWACFIDHDACFTTQDWYRQLECIIELLKEPCVLTCKTNRVNSPWQRIDSVDPNNHSMVEHRRIGEALAREFGNRLTDVTDRSLMSGVVILLSKRTWRLLGGFSHGFFGVDNQLHEAARNHGFRVYLMDGVYVYHWYRADGGTGRAALPRLADPGARNFIAASSAITTEADTEPIANPDPFLRRVTGLQQTILERIPTFARRILVYGNGNCELGRRLAGCCRSLERMDDHVEPSSPISVTSIEHLEGVPDVESFDCIICGDQLARERHPIDVLRRLRECLAGHGCLLAVFPNARRQEIVARLLEGTWHETLSVDDTRHYVRQFTRREVEKLLYRAEFSARELAVVPNAELDSWRKQGLPEQVRCGGLQMSGLDRREAEEFFVDYYFASAAPADRHKFGITSIVIVTHNQMGYTRQCVNSLLQFTDQPFELILVDNGSTDGTKEYLQALQGVRILNNEENRGFPAAANQGIRVARGEFVLLLNNDTLVTTVWLDRMLAAMASDAAIGLVGPSSNNVSGEQAVVASYTELTCLDGFAWDWAKAHYGEIQSCDRLVGFCLLIRRAVVEKIGLLDERFGIGNFEDDDYCIRARRAGFRAVIARDAFVHHFGGRTFVASGVDYGALLEQNRQQFEEKWAGTHCGEPSTSAVRDTKKPRYALRRHEDGGLILVPDPPRLSLCMIVRDNEKTISKALESIRPWVDELIVVDTGSKDATPEIARVLGARVYSFPWVDDFSAARNESLRHARGEWIFWMDSDDTITQENGQKLRQLLGQPPPTNVLGYVMQVHCPNDGRDGDKDATIVDHIKLFRNLSELRFEGRVHEQIMPAIRRVGGDVAWTEIFVVHSGADHTPEGRQRKQQRDMRLLELEAQERPDNSFVLFNIGMTFADMEDHQSAVSSLEQSIGFSDPSESHLRKAYALLVASLSQLERFDDADRVCRAGLELFPNDLELLFREGFVAQHLGEFERSIAAYCKALGAGGQRQFNSIDRGLRGYKTRHNLALVYEALHRHELAEEQWRLVMAEMPSYRPAWHGLADNLIAQGKWDEAAREAERPSTRQAGETDTFQIRSRIAKAQGDLVGARQQLQAGLAADPLNQETLDQLCKFEFEFGQPSESAARLKELIALDPENASAWHNLGSTWLRLNEIQAAEEAFRQAISLRPKSAVSYLYLGFVLEQRGDLPGAIESWEEAISVAPNDQAAMEARERLNRAASHSASE